jgi:hypothetical protein
LTPMARTTLASATWRGTPSSIAPSKNSWANSWSRRSSARPTFQFSLRLATAHKISYVIIILNEGSDVQQSPRIDGAPTVGTEARPSRSEAPAGNDGGGDSSNGTARARQPTARLLERREIGQARSAATSPQVEGKNFRPLGTSREQRWEQVRNEARNKQRTELGTNPGTERLERIAQEAILFPEKPTINLHPKRGNI